MLPTEAPVAEEVSPEKTNIPSSTDISAVPELVVPRASIISDTELKRSSYQLEVIIEKTIDQLGIGRGPMLIK